MKDGFFLTVILILVSTGSTVTYAQRNKPSQPGTPNAKKPINPCNQLTGDDLLFKNRRCALSNGQTTTIGAYQQAPTNSNPSKVLSPTENSAFNQMETLSSNVKGSASTGEDAQPRKKANQRSPNKRNQMLDDPELLDLKANKPKSDSIITLPVGTDTARPNQKNKPNKTKRP